MPHGVLVLAPVVCSHPFQAWYLHVHVCARVCALCFVGVYGGEHVHGVCGMCLLGDRSRYGCHWSVYMCVECVFQVSVMYVLSLLGTSGESVSFGELCGVVCVGGFGGGCCGTLCMTGGVCVHLESVGL